MNETIAAIATSSTIASIGIIRISGEKSFDIVKKIFKPKNPYKEIEHQKMKYGYIMEGNEIIDEVMVTFFISPISFTRENVCEINCHGGIVILNKILKLVIKNGARLAMPGEFTKRAFLNGRIDLSQAEAVIDILNAKTEKSLKESQKQLKGNLSITIKDIENDLLEVLSDIEANIDYPEYDIEEITNKKLKEKVKQIKNKTEKLLSTFEKGKILRDGISIAIIGKPNVGKSSILNMLLREERAIVTDIAGTTRDIIEEYINIKGIPIKIIDTAGIRNSDNIVEKIGIEKSFEILNQADIVFFVIDNSSKITSEDEKIMAKLDNKKTILIINKIDLKSIDNIGIIKNNFTNSIEISAKENKGLEEIEDMIYLMCNIEDKIKENETVLVNLRHKDIIDRVNNEINAVLNEINKHTPIDIISIKLMEALQILGEITGKTVTDEIVDKIFSKFCLGK